MLNQLLKRLLKREFGRSPGSGSASEPMRSPAFAWLITSCLASLLAIPLVSHAAENATVSSGGLCFSQADRSVRAQIPQTLVGAITRALEPPENERHSSALLAAQVVYQLADLETTKSAEEFIAKHKSYRQHIPSGYQNFGALSDRMTGWKYVILAPQEPSWPWILSFAGTETVIDWLADLRLGRSQIQARLMDLLPLFTHCEKQNPLGQPLSAHKWIITGHSLGGGLAQAFAYRVQELRLQAKLSPAQIELVTFNAFGASEVVGLNGKEEKQEKKIDTRKLVASLNAKNYFVTGDPISKIGQHIGPTYEISIPDSAPALSLVERHSLATVSRLVHTAALPSRSLTSMDKRFDFSIARPSRPPQAPVLNHLKTVGTYLPVVPETLTETSMASDLALDRLDEIARVLISRNLNQRYDREALIYVVDISNLALKKLLAQSGGVMRDIRIERLQKLIRQSKTAIN